MPTELPATDMSQPSTVVADDWTIEDSGRVRATPEELAADMASGLSGTQAGEVNTVTEAAPLPEPETGDHSLDAAMRGDEDEPAVKAEEPEAKPTKGKRTLTGRVQELQREVGKLSAAKREELAAIERLRRERQALERPAASDVRASASDAAPAVPDGRPAVPAKPVWGEYDKAGKSWEEYETAKDAYSEALVEAKTWDRFEALRRESAERDADLRRSVAEREQRDAQIRVETMHHTKVDAARAEHPDFDEAIKGWDEVPQVPFLRDAVMWHPKGADILYDLGKTPETAATLASLEFTNEMMDAVMASSAPSALLRHLADTPEDYQRIVQMPSRQALVALGALDARLSVVSPAPARVHGSRPVTVSKAAPPIRPVAGGARTTLADVDPDDLDIDSYVKVMNARERSARL